MGSGMVHPNVFGFVGYDTAKYTGFAFGGGIDRYAALKYNINDLQLFLQSDIRFLEQFR
jgi:phenylalanyl-tRNA synthetase alpha chain